MSSQISVYGATGFIGSAFCRIHTERAIAIERAENRPASDEILYFISTTHNFNVFDQPQLDIDTNLKKLVDVLCACKERKPVVNFVSSWFVYGAAELPAAEEMTCQPRGFYSITKRCAEDLVRSFCETFEIPFRILRLSNVYGPGDRASKQKNALQFLIDRLARHEEIELVYGGDFIRDYLHVRDTVAALLHCIDRAPKNVTLNVGSGTPYRFRDLIEEARRLTGSSSQLHEVAPTSYQQQVQVKDMCLDVSRLRALGFRPEVDIHAGIAELCARALAD